MEKEQIISTLKEKVGQTTFSDRSLTSYVENNLPTEGTEPDDAYWTKHVNIIKSFQGQFNADVAASITSQLDAKVAEYYQKNPDKLKEYIKSHPELIADNGKGGSEKDEKYEALKAEIETLKSAQKERERLATESQMREQVLGKMKAEGLNINQALWEDAVKAAEIKEGDKVENLYSTAKGLYEKNYKRVFGDGAKPYESGRQSFVPNSDDTVKNFFEKKKKKEGWG